MLRQLGWDIETAEHAHLTGKIDDTKWIIHARKNHRIALTFDELRAKQGERVSRELRRRGGKVIRIQGGPGQNKFRAVAKLLYHYPKWYPFLKVNEGISVVSDIRPQQCRNYTPSEYHQAFHHLDAELFFKKYIEKHKNRPYKPRGKKPKPSPTEQDKMTI